jgi:DNA (cytosine-5)-methyltransferase 1
MLQTFHIEEPQQTLDLFGDALGGSAKPELFSVEKDRIVRSILCRDGSQFRSSIDLPNNVCRSDDLSADFDAAWLRLNFTPRTSQPRGVVKIGDVFSGCGGMTLGIFEACRALQLTMKSSLAIESDPRKLEVYQANFSSEVALSEPIETMVDGKLGTPPTSSERALKEKVGVLDILVGGPPCQGHSDLNNFTRRADPRNNLILRLVRAVELFRPNHVMVENVQGIRHDKCDSVGIAIRHLTQFGYCVDQGLIDCSRIGIPQNRRRFFLVASLERSPRVSSIASDYLRPERSVQWACGDLLDIDSDAAFDSSAKHSESNQARIRYLFERDIYDLPDEVRPDCHRLKNHAYRAVYGRMWWDKPAPTITTGFGSTGQGRFVHPKRPRTLTPHEAARLQTIPDFFRFQSTARTQLQKMIGNAVPPKIAYLLMLELLR